MGRYNDEWILINKRGEYIPEGEMIYSTDPHPRGTEYEFLFISRTPEPGKTGKVIVQEEGKPFQMELYAHVFDCMIVKRTKLSEEIDKTIHDLHAGSSLADWNINFH